MDESVNFDESERSRAGGEGGQEEGWEEGEGGDAGHGIMLFDQNAPVAPSSRR